MRRFWIFSKNIRSFAVDDWLSIKIKKSLLIKRVWLGLLTLLSCINVIHSWGFLKIDCVVIIIIIDRAVPVWNEDDRGKVLKSNLEMIWRFSLILGCFWAIADRYFKGTVDCKNAAMKVSVILKLWITGSWKFVYEFIAGNVSLLLGNGKLMG